jgi:branched-chain amino acid transport system ATP-binding protein
MDSALRVEGLRVLYQRAVLGIVDASLTVGSGQLVALLGSNGAGKSTLLRALSLTLRYSNGRVAAGSITAFGQSLDGTNPHVAIEAGISHVPEGRRVFTKMTVEENLRAGGFAAKSPRQRQEAKDRVYSLFPQLADKRAMRAGLLSGGEQQMIAIGRALMATPRLLLLDEPSLGLSPQMTDRVKEAITAINREGTTVLLVEQNAGMALSLATHAYVLDTGRVVLSGSSEELRWESDVIDRYLGGTAKSDVAGVLVGREPRRRALKPWVQP